MTRVTRASDHLVFVSGQLDCDEEGVVTHTGDLISQIAGIITQLEKRLEQEATQLSDLVKLVVYYAQEHAVEETLRLALGQRLGNTVRTAVTFVPLRRLSHADALLEVEAIAIDKTLPRTHAVVAELGDPGIGFCHGLTCGEFTFLSGQSAVSSDGSILYPDDLVSQNKQTIENLRRVLAVLSVNTRDITKVNSWRAPEINHSVYQEAANDRFRFLSAAGPAVTGITIPRLKEIGHQIRLDLWAMDPELRRRQINPPNHWGWKTRTSYSQGLQAGPWLFVGGQAALTRECDVQHPNDALAQIDVTREFIESVLGEATGEFEIVNVNGMYCATSDSHADQLTLRLLRSQFHETLPARTIVPVDRLAYAHQSIEIDAVARRRS